MSSSPKPAKSSLPAPQRVSGGLVISIGNSKINNNKKHQQHPKKKTSKKLPKSSNDAAAARTSDDATRPSHDAAASRAVGIPSVLTRDPRRNVLSLSPTACETKRHNTCDDDDGEFDDDPFEVDCASLSDVWMCLRSYTRSTTGGFSEHCAYCPMVTTVSRPVSFGAVGHGAGRDGEKTPTSSRDNGDATSLSVACAAPFLSRRVLCHVMGVSDGRHGCNVRTDDVERELIRLAVQNEIRLLQLHGTAAAMTSNSGHQKSGGIRGDGNDDDDVAVMETGVYESAARMALETHFYNNHCFRNNDGKSMNGNAFREQDHWSASTETPSRMENIVRWFTNEILPHFAGKTWISSSAWESFRAEQIQTSSSGSGKKRKFQSTCTAQKNVRVLYTSTEIDDMLQDLIHAGLLLPRRGLGCNGGEGYW